MSNTWKKGRGKLGVLKPLLGQWQTRAESDLGPVRCTRIFEPVMEAATFSSGRVGSTVTHPAARRESHMKRSR